MRILNALALTVLMTGCGDLSDSAKKGNKADDVNIDLIGGWQADCFDVSALDLAKGKKEINFNAIGDFEKVESLYLDETCQDKAIEYRVSGAYASLDKLEENQALTKLNYTTEQALITVYSQDAVDMLNTAKVCGIEDWQVEKEEDITGKDCGPFTVKKGDVVFDVYQIQDDELKVGGSLFLGNLNDDSDDRPKEVIQEITLTRK